jgi:hypothetical protein
MDMDRKGKGGTLIEDGGLGNGQVPGIQDELDDVAMDFHRDLHLSLEAGEPPVGAKEKIIVAGKDVIGKLVEGCGIHEVLSWVGGMGGDLRESS